MISINTKRLKLIPLTHQSLSLLKKDRALMEASLGLNISQMAVEAVYLEEIEDALDNFWLPMTKTNEPVYEWFTNWEIIHKELNLSIGGIGFVGFPENGIAETGFMLDTNFVGQGFAAEALNAIVAWALENPSIRGVKARTYSDNHRARALLDRCGFKFEMEDEGLLHYCRLA